MSYRLIKKIKAFFAPKVNLQHVGSVAIERLLENPEDAYKEIIKASAQAWGINMNNLSQYKKDKWGDNEEQACQSLMDTIRKGIVWIPKVRFPPH